MHLLPPSACNVLIELHLRQYLARVPHPVCYTPFFVFIKRTVVDTFLEITAAHLAQCCVPEGLKHQKLRLKEWLQHRHGQGVYHTGKEFGPGGKGSECVSYRFPLDGTGGISDTAAAIELLVQQLQLPVTYQSTNNQEVEALPPGCNTHRYKLAHISPQQLSEYREWCATPEAKQLLLQCWGQPAAPAAPQLPDAPVLPPAAADAAVQQGPRPAGGVQQAASHSAASQGPEQVPLGRPAVEAAMAFAPDMPGATAAAAAESAAADGSGLAVEAGTAAAAAAAGQESAAAIGSGLVADAGAAAAGEGVCLQHARSSCSQQQAVCRAPLPQQGLRSRAGGQQLQPAPRQRGSSCSDADGTGPHLGLAMSRDTGDQAAGGGASSAPAACDMGNTKSATGRSKGLRAASSAGGWAAANNPLAAAAGGAELAVASGGSCEQQAAGASGSGGVEAAAAAAAKASTPPQQGFSSTSSRQQLQDQAPPQMQQGSHAAAVGAAGVAAPTGAPGDAVGSRDQQGGCGEGEVSGRALRPLPGHKPQPPADAPTSSSAGPSAPAATDAAATGSAAVRGSLEREGSSRGSGRRLDKQQQQGPVQEEVQVLLNGNQAAGQPLTASNSSGGSGVPLAGLLMEGTDQQTPTGSKRAAAAAGEQRGASSAALAAAASTSRSGGSSSGEGAAAGASSSGRAAKALPSAGAVTPGVPPAGYAGDGSGSPAGAAAAASPGLTRGFLNRQQPSSSAARRQQPHPSAAAAAPAAPTAAAAAAGASLERATSSKSSGRQPNSKQQQGPAQEEVQVLLNGNQAAGRPLRASNSSDSRTPLAGLLMEGTNQQTPTGSKHAAAAAGEQWGASSAALVAATSTSCSSREDAAAGGRGSGGAAKALPSAGAVTPGVPPAGDAGDTGDTSSPAGAAAAASPGLKPGCLDRQQPSSSAGSGQQPPPPVAAGAGHMSPNPAAVAGAADGGTAAALPADGAGRSTSSNRAGDGGDPAAGAAAAAAGNDNGASDVQQEELSSLARRQDVAASVQQLGPLDPAAQVLPGTPAAGGAAPAPGGASSGQGGDAGDAAAAAGSKKPQQYSRACARNLQGVPDWNNCRWLATGGFGSVARVPLSSGGHMVVKTYLPTTMSDRLLNNLMAYVDANRLPAVKPAFHGVMPEILGVRVFYDALTDTPTSVELWMECMGPQSKDVLAVMTELLDPAREGRCIFSGVTLVRPGRFEQVCWYPRPLTGWQLQALFVPVVKLVLYLHSRGYIHRDLKASNVLAVNPAPLYSPPHPAAVAAAHKAKAAAAKMAQQLVGLGESEEDARAIAEGKAQRVWAQEMAAAAAAGERIVLPLEQMEARLLDHDGLVYKPPERPASSRPQMQQQPPVPEVPVSMFTTVAGMKGKVAPEVAAKVEKPDANGLTWFQQAACAAKTREADIFGLGVYLLHLLMGCPDLTPVADLIRSNRNLATLLDLLKPDPQVRQVVEACCHEDPAQRATAEQLMQMPFCNLNHPTILAWDGPLRPERVPKTFLLL